MYVQFIYYIQAGKTCLYDRSIDLCVSMYIPLSINVFFRIA